MAINHVIVHQQDMQGRERVLIDRQTLARLMGRSEHTIRAQCPVVCYRDGKAMYDMDACDKLLKDKAKRQRGNAKQAA